MTVSCPDRGSRYWRASRHRSLREKLRDLAGVSLLGCGDCGTRFVARTWDLAAITHSRCPKCLRRPGPFMKLPIRLAHIGGAANTAAPTLWVSGRGWRSSASIVGEREGRAESRLRPRLAALQMAKQIGSK